MVIEETKIIEKSVNRIVNKILNIYDKINDDSFNIFYYQSINEILDFLLEFITIYKIKDVNNNDDNKLLIDMKLLLNEINNFIKSYYEDDESYNFANIETSFNDIYKIIIQKREEDK